MLLFLVGLVFFHPANAQGYRITLKTNWKDTSILLGYYYGKYQYVLDTAKADKTGLAVFEKKDTVRGGIYFFVFPNKKFLEFILDKDRKISFEADTSDLINTMKVKGSEDNVIFNQYQRYVTARGKEVEELSKKLKNLKDKNPKSDSIKILEDKIKALTDEVNTYKNDLVKKYPQSLLTKTLIASKDPEIPENVPMLENGKKDSLYIYMYYRKHYWDNIDLTDDRLLRTPVFHNKLETYFTKVVPQIPDTIIKEADAFIDKVKGNKELFKYVSWYLTYTYETSQVMGMDAVFVYLVDKIYRPGLAYWVSENTRKKIVDRADKIKPNLIGKIAPELVLIDTANNLVSLHSIKAKYLVVYFWDPQCGHCAKETPKLVEYFNRVKDSMDIKVYAVCTDTSLTRWKKGIKEKHMENFINVNGTRTAYGNFHESYDIYSTPVVYILDQRKRIIAKRLPVEQIGSFIIQYDKKPLFKD
jgi:peroxiredoxin